MIAVVHRVNKLSTANLWLVGMAVVATWVLTSASVLFNDVVPGDYLPAYEVRISAFTPAAPAALAHDLWGECRKTVGVAVGETL